MAFLNNIWYVAAWDNEITTEAVFHRTILNRSIAFFRDKDGVVKALDNRCPHRFAPLHMGTRIPTGIRCIYHGLEFDGNGKCTRNPHGNGAIPKAASVKTYPVCERYSAIWIWMGDPTAADDTKIPEFGHNDPDRFIVGKRYLHARANYVLETDNIMDLGHIEFLHPGTLGTSSVSKGTTEISQTGNTVFSKRLMRSEILSEFLYEMNAIEPGTLVDRWIDVRWSPPSNMALYSGAVPAGEASDIRGGRVMTHHFTPETETTTHYWFANSFSKELGSAGIELAEKHIGWLNKPFVEEDIPMLEAQQKAMGDLEFWELKPVLLSTDAAAIRARRVLDQLIADEQEQ